MIINGQDVNIDDLYNEKYMHKMNTNGLFLSEYQIGVLNSYGIKVDKIGSINELIYAIDEILDDDSDCDDLDMISREIIEFNYYANTDK